MPPPLLLQLIQLLLAALQLLPPWLQLRARRACACCTAELLRLRLRLPARASVENARVAA